MRTAQNDAVQPSQSEASQSCKEGADGRPRNNHSTERAKPPDAETELSSEFNFRPDSSANESDKQLSHINRSSVVAEAKSVTASSSKLSGSGRKRTSAESRRKGLEMRTQRGRKGPKQGGRKRGKSAGRVPVVPQERISRADWNRDRDVHQVELSETSSSSEAEDTSKCGGFL